MGITDRNKPLAAEEVPATRRVADSRRYMLRGAIKWLFHGRTVNRRYTATDRFYLMQWPNVAEKYCQVMEANESKGCIRTLEPGEIDDGPIESWVPTSFFCSERRQRDQTTKGRIGFDSTTRYGRISLNDTMSPGP